MIFCKRIIMVYKRTLGLTYRCGSDIAPPPPPTFGGPLGPISLGIQAPPPRLILLAKLLCTDILIKLSAHDYDAITRASVWWEGLGGLEMGYQRLAGFVYERGKSLNNWQQQRQQWCGGWGSCVWYRM